MARLEVKEGIRYGLRLAWLREVAGGEREGEAMQQEKGGEACIEWASHRVHVGMHIVDR
jgi:hypothetical protein